MSHYYVYIMTGRCGIFYTGVTNDLVRRVLEHRSETSQFTGQYKLSRLVYFESTPHVREAISREKQVKPWRREKKIALFRRMNPRLLDLGETVLGLGALTDPKRGGSVPDATTRPALHRDGFLHSVLPREGLRSG